MQKKISKYIYDSGEAFLIFLKWVCIGGGIGIVVGAIGICFHWMLETATEFRMAHASILWLLPFGGLLIVFLYRRFGMANDRGTNFILVAVRQNEAVSLRTAPLVFCSTVITHLFGGSAGREGAALQLGGSIASYMGRLIHLNEKDERIITMCGMAAGFSALFGTPLTAVVFSMEVISVGIMHYSAIVPATVAALAAAGMAQGLGFQPTAFLLTGIPNAISLKTGLAVGTLAICCALVSMLFCIVMEQISHVYRAHIKNAYIRVFVGGSLLIALTLLLGTRDYNGAGMDVIQRAVAGEARPEAFLIKIIFTAITLGAGFKGGEIVPSFFIGATLGCVLGPIFGLSASFAAGLAMTAVFCGVTNCALASVVLCIELFGAQGLAYYGLCCGISYMLSGYYGLYSEQKIMYSKVKPEFIDKNAR